MKPNTSGILNGSLYLVSLLCILPQAHSKDLIPEPFSGLEQFVSKYEEERKKFQIEYSDLKKRTEYAITYRDSAFKIIEGQKIIYSKKNFEKIVKNAPIKFEKLKSLEKTSAQKKLDEVNKWGYQVYGDGQRLHFLTRFEERNVRENQDIFGFLQYDFENPNHHKFEKIALEFCNNSIRNIDWNGPSNCASIVTQYLNLSRSKAVAEKNTSFQASIKAYQNELSKFKSKFNELKKGGLLVRTNHQLNYYRDLSNAIKHRLAELDNRSKQPNYDDRDLRNFENFRGNDFFSECFYDDRNERQDPEVEKECLIKKSNLLSTDIRNLESILNAQIRFLYKDEMVSKSSASDSKKSTAARFQI